MTNPERSSLDETLTPSDAALWETLARCLARPERPGLCMSAGTAHMLEQVCPPIALSSALIRRLQAQVQRAERDLAFEAAVTAGQRRFSLGAYLAFLRQQAGLTAAEAAKKFAVDFQFLTDLERDALRPQRIPGRRLALLLRRLRGSLEQAERLLPTTIRAPRTLAAAQPGRLYRTARGATRADAEAASGAARGEPAREIPNPEYRDEVEAVHRLARELRASWKR
jgi:transcriptional regulator with XRE-family HTH domain